MDIKNRLQFLFYQVLTATHCLSQIKGHMKDFTVTLGEHEFERHEGTEQAIKVKRVIKHPGYDVTNLLHDIALIELERPVILNGRVGLPCFPKKDVFPVN